MRLIDKDELIKSLGIPEDMECCHCEWAYTYGGCTRDSLSDACFFIKEAEEIGRWIPCSERVPETDMCRTLTTIRTPHKGTNVRSGCFYRGLFMNDNGDTWNATDKEVLAWMPMPEPYKEGEEDGRSRFY